MPRPSKYTKEEAISSLQKAEEILGEPPSIKQYKELDLSPPAKTIRSSIFDSWNEAKNSSGLSTNMTTNVEEQSVPSMYNFSEKEWKSMNKQKRLKYRKRQYWADEKLERGCNNCGYNKNPVALEWHHTDSSEKNDSVSNLINLKRSRETIRKEVKKCTVLCSNCHKIETHSDNYSF
jgi:hypothetical protein